MYSISEIRALDHNSIVNSFSGTVSKVGDRKAGESAKGPWSFQHIRIVDGKGDDIKVTLKDRPELPKSFINCAILIKAHNSEKGWSGVKAYDDTYNDNKERILWVTGSAVISNGNGATPAATGSGTASPPAQQNIPVAGTGDPIKDARNFISRAANLYGMCLDAAVEIGKLHEQRNKMLMPPEQFQAVVSSIWIAAKDARMHLQLPVTPIFGAFSEEEIEVPHDDV